MSHATAHPEVSRPKPTRTVTSALAAVPLLLGTLVVGLLGASQPAVYTVADSPAYSMWANSVTPRVAADPDPARVTVGVNFSSKVSGKVTALRFYRSAANLGPHTGQLWTAGGTLLSKVSFAATTRTGWQVARLAAPVTLQPAKRYVASYTAPHGRYAADTHALSPTSPHRTQDLTAWKGVYSYGSGVPTNTYSDSNYYVDVLFARTTTAVPPAPTSTPAPTTGFPTADNTGPSGTLTPYTGPCTITTAGTIIDSKTVGCDLDIRAKGVVVRNSRIDGRIVSSTTGASVAVSDSLIDGGQQETFPTVSYQNITLTRVEVTGGQHSVQCSSACTVLDSWLHGQYLPRTSAGHVNAFISNGGSGFVLRHNTLHCTPEPTASGGCTADASLFGDFEPISNATFDNNLFKARSDGASYCLHAGYNPSKPYGAHPAGVVVTRNVFERGANRSCGIYGPVTSFLTSGIGNVWSGNTWSTGETVAP